VRVVVVGFHQSLTKKKKSTRKEDEKKGRQRRRPSIRNNNNNCNNYNYLVTRRAAKGFGWHYYFEKKSDRSIIFLGGLEKNFARWNFIGEKKRKKGKKKIFFIGKTSTTRSKMSLEKKEPQ
jgi:hypothetical protein